MSQAVKDSSMDNKSVSYPVPSDDEKKRLEAPLVLGTTYTLNSSETKKISIGLQLRADGSIRPIVKLQSNTTAGGIVFESEAWNLLQRYTPEISKYFSGGQKIAWGSNWRTPTPIAIDDDCEILFTSSYGSKSIVFDRRIIEDAQPYDNNNCGASTPVKKRKNYSPAVVMQKASFEGLVSVMGCIDERFRRLQRNIKHVENCVEILCSELLLHIPANEIPEKVDDLRVKELIKNNFKTLKDAVQVRLDPMFVELTFNIVFLELTALCTPFITNELRKALGSKNTRR